jgi:hypothetical protein
MNPTNFVSRAIGPPQSLPAPVIGDENMEAGDWCKFTMQAPFPFSAAVKGHRLKGNLLGRLLTMEGKNEPVIRPGHRAN